jgi:hypothetical protein
MVASYRVNRLPQTNLIQLPGRASKNIFNFMGLGRPDGSDCRLRRALCAVALIALCGGPIRADEVADIYQRLQNEPRNVALNLQYAKAAEKAGKLKWALPAYERALSAAPGNQEAKSGIDRITNRLRAEAGPS